MNPITLDAIKLMLDMQDTKFQNLMTKESRDLCLTIMDKLLNFMNRDIDDVIEKTSKFLK